MSDDQIDLMGALTASLQSARQRTRDNKPCPTCGGDRLRTDFTGSGQCHAPRAGVVGQEEKKR